MPKFPTPSQPAADSPLPRYDYLCKLLQDLQIDTAVTAVAAADSAARWRECGLAALTGPAAAPVLEPPLPLACYADATLDAIRVLSGRRVTEHDGAEFLTRRAQMTGLSRRGDCSTGGACRLLATADGTIALSLARDDDWQLVPAWLQVDEANDWCAVAAQLRRRHSTELLHRGRLLGLALAWADTVDGEQDHWFRVCQRGRPATVPGTSPRVLDLSSLWAGPLCGHILQRCGAEVTKVESSRRPDGGRFGSTAFFDYLNGDKRQLTLDLHTAGGRGELLDLIAESDIVLESSRPRALQQMGIEAEKLVADQPGLTWMSFTGHGRSGVAANWIAYGDDAGVAAGLSALLHARTGQWLFCGDAIADPLAGLHAALAALASWRRGGGQLIDVSLGGTVRHCISFYREQRR